MMVFRVDAGRWKAMRSLRQTLRMKSVGWTAETDKSKLVMTIVIMAIVLVNSRIKFLVVMIVEVTLVNAASLYIRGACYLNPLKSN